MTRRRSRQKPRFLPATTKAMSAETAQAVSAKEGK
jgi:hypothetical protein